MATATAAKPRATKLTKPVGSNAAIVAKVTNKLTGTLGSTIDEAFALREEKRALEVKVKVIETKIATLNEILFERMDAEQTTKAQGTAASVSITSATVANVTDWEALWPWIAKNKHFHMIQKRVSDPAARELWEMGKTIPGVEPFTARKINLRTISA